MLTDRQTDRAAGMQVGRQTEWQEGRQTDRQPVRHIGSQEGRQAYRQTNRWQDVTQTDRETRVPIKLGIVDGND